MKTDERVARVDNLYNDQAFTLVSVEDGFKSGELRCLRAGRYQLTLRWQGRYYCRPNHRRQGSRTLPLKETLARGIASLEQCQHCSNDLESWTIGDRRRPGKKNDEQQGASEDIRRRSNLPAANGLHREVLGAAAKKGFWLPSEFAEMHRQGFLERS